MRTPRPKGIGPDAVPPLGGLALTAPFSPGLTPWAVLFRPLRGSPRSESQKQKGPPQQNLWVRFSFDHRLPIENARGYGSLGSSGIRYRNSRRIGRAPEYRGDQAGSGHFFFSRCFSGAIHPQISLKTQNFLSAAAGRGLAGGTTAQRQPILPILSFNTPQWDCRKRSQVDWRLRSGAGSIPWAFRRLQPC